MNNSISFLLGAGFSVPIGYPSAKCLGLVVKQIINNEVNKIEEIISRTMYTGHFRAKIFQTMIHHYESDHNNFNYEDFYEYIDYCCKNEAIGKELSKYEQGKCICKMNRNYQAMYQNYLYPLLMDRCGRQIYEKTDTDVFDIYSCFLQSLNFLLKKKYVINVHTLNHDLLFESFKYHPIINNEISDGYSLNDSPYSGITKFKEVVKLPYYKGEYNKKIRLYKLHGSIDQYAYYTGSQNGYMSYDNHIKVSNEIDTNKELIKECNGFKDEFSFLDIVPDFLTGNKSKGKAYNKKYYEELFSHFKNNLNNAECLIIIGYSGNDTEINERIKDNFDYRNKQSFIFDPFPNPNLQEFARQINAQIIETSAEKIELSTILNY